MLSLPIFVALISVVSSSDNFYSFKVKDIRGNDADLFQFNGKVTLLVNTASQCSLTDSHMKSLKRLHDILSFGDKFNVIVFPSNDFGDQEPWDEPEIEEYIRGHFKAEFPIMAKSSVIGDKALDVWKWVGKTSVPPKWNFDKYLINREGVIVGHWPGETTVESIFNTIQNLIDGTEFVQPTSAPSTIGSDTKGESEETQAKDEL